MNTTEHAQPRAPHHRHEGCGAGHSGRRLRIDLDSGATSIEEVSASDCRRFLGGGTEATRLLLKETEPGYEALSPSAPLMFMSTAVTGHPYVALARVIVVAKSPLTEGVGESRVEGRFGQQLVQAGLDGIVVTGRCDMPSILVIDSQYARLEPRPELWGLDTAQTFDRLAEDFGPKASVAAIGVAGERAVRFASIEFDRAFSASRMGLGAVMGAKLLKAVVIVAPAAGGCPVHDREAMEVLTAEYAAATETNPGSRGQAQPPGFGGWITSGDVLVGYAQGPNYMTSVLPLLPTDTSQVLGERVVVSEDTCPGCPGHCIKIFDNRVDPRAGGLGQEALPAFAFNLAITDIEQCLDLNALCHLWGVDPVSMTFTVALLCEAAARYPELVANLELGGHSPRFGDGPGLTALMEDIAAMKAPVAWLGAGVARVARLHPDLLGPLAMHVKGLEMVSFDPRVSAGQALAYAVSPLGPRYEIVEHDIDFDPVVGPAYALDLMKTIGFDAWEPMDQLDASRVVRTAALVEITSGLDALGVSVFAGPPMRAFGLPEIARLVAASTGWVTSDAEILAWGRRRWNLMRLFNLREGLTNAEDTLPDRFFDESIDAGRHSGVSIDRGQFETALAFYYAVVGWDKEGRPTAATLAACQLLEFAHLGSTSLDFS